MSKSYRRRTYSRISLKNADDELNSFINNGMELGNAAAYVQAAYNDGAISSDAYNKYKLIIQAKAEDEARESRK